MNLQEKLHQQALSIEKEEVAFEEKNNIINLPVIEQRLTAIDVVPDFAITLAEAKQRVQMLQNFVKEMMVAGQDYGVITGVAKPTLLKPGAEKLTEIFGFSKQVSITNRVEDWDKGLFAFEVKVSLINKRTGYMEAEGVGLCNTKENKYVSQNPFTIANTVLKMAKKRALVDAVLSATRSSGIFTQDIENMDLPDQNIAMQQRQAVQSNSVSRPQLTGNVTSAQLKKIETLTKKIGMSSLDEQGLIKEKFGIINTSQLNKNQASTLIQHLLALQ